jgi:catechol 2,3-dioxygenase-like lactoylglutathione lyase family enzyme
MSIPLVKGFRHTGIIVKNMESSRQFYENILGLEVVQDYEDDSNYINDVLGLSGGNIRMIKLKTQDGYIIELLEYINHPTKVLSSPFYNVGNCHIAFTVSDADEMYKKLLDKGIEVISRPLLSSEKTAIVFFCCDPNGIRVELVEMVK